VLGQNVEVEVVSIVELMFDVEEGSCCADAESVSRVEEVLGCC